MTNTIKLLAPSAAASWLGSGASARPRPAAGDERLPGSARPGGEFGSVTPAGSVLTLVYGAPQATAVTGVSPRQADPTVGNLRQTSTIRTMMQHPLYRFRHWSPPD